MRLHFSDSFKPLTFTLRVLPRISRTHRDNVCYNYFVMSQHILLLGGHGKISQLLTPILLSRSYAVTSIIREQAQVATIAKLGEGQPGKLNVLVRSLEEVKSERDARSIIDEVKPSWVIWSAGMSPVLSPPHAS